jgi:hypothetical protein
MTHYLYIKTHNKTGLKYLGKTTQDPYTYKGSGKVWRHHLKKHGMDVTTEVVGIYNSNAELAEAGLALSKELNVVESKDWANLKEEAGDGGPGPYNLESNRRVAALGGYARKNRTAWNKGKSTPRTSESIEKQRQTITGKKRGPYKNYNHEASSCPVMFRGKEYPSISAARQDTGASFYTVKRHSRTVPPAQEP